MSYGRFRIDDAGAVGFISAADQRPHRTPPNAWTIANNVRFEDGEVESAAGWQAVLSPSTDGRTWLDYVLGDTRAWWLLFSNTQIRTVQSGNVITDVSRATPYTTGPDDFWSTSNFKGLPVATNGADIPQVQFASDTLVPGPTTAFQDWLGWTVTDPVDLVTKYNTMRARLVVAYRDFLVFANFIEDWNGDERATRVWWSARAGTGLLPPDMDAHDPTSASGYFDLPGGSGPILSINLLRDSVYIYCSKAVWRMTETGGSLVMRFDRVTGNWGALGAFAVAEFDQEHLVITQDDIVRFDGQQKTSIAKGRVRNWFFEQLGVEGATVFAATYSEKHEVWLALDATGTDVGTADKALVYQWIDNVWSTRDVPALYHGKAMPRLDEPKGETTAPKWSNIPLSTDRWSDPTWANIEWGGTSIKLGRTYDYQLYAMSDQPSADPVLQEMDIGFQHEGVETYRATLESLSIDITGDERTAIVVSAYPQAETDIDSPIVYQIETWQDAADYEGGVQDGWNLQGVASWADFTSKRTPFEITIGGQKAVEADPRYAIPQPFESGKDYRVTTKSRGRRHAVRISSNENRWKFGGLTLRYAQAGER